MMEMAQENGRVTSAAEFVGGFLLGMTADSHLTEIEHCMTGGELLVHEIESGVARIKAGGLENIAEAVAEFGLAVVQIPQALRLCKSMEDELVDVYQWAEIFKDPAQLSATVAKNYVFHRGQIKSDIAALEGDLSADLYFRSGVDLADLMTLAVGPIETNEAILGGSAIEIVPDYTAGLIFGFTGNDHKAELEGCMTDLQPLADSAMAALADLKALHFVSFIQDLGDIIWMLPDAVSSCGELTDLQADIQVMLDWAEQLKQPVKAFKTASMNWLFHGVQIKANIAKEEADWASEDYYNAGIDSANVLLGLVPLDTAFTNDMAEPSII